MEGRECNSLIFCIPFKLNKRCRLRNSLHLSFGAGTHIGFAVAAQLREKGYRVALGSRNSKPATNDDAYFNVKVDVQKRESIEEAFDTVVRKLGPVNVVIYNGKSVFPLDKKYVWLTLPVSCFCHCTTNTRRPPHNSSRRIL
jgi:hypothetical protein